MVVIALLLVTFAYVSIEQNMANTYASTGHLSGDTGIGNTISYADGWDGMSWVGANLLTSQNQVTVSFPAGDNISSIIVIFGNSTTQVKSLLENSNIFYGISAVSSGGLLTAMNVVIGSVRNGSASSIHSSHAVVGETYNATIFNAKNRVNYLGETQEFPLMSLLYSYPYAEPAITASMFVANDTSTNVMALTIFFEIFHATAVNYGMAFAEMMLLLSMTLLLYVVVTYESSRTADRRKPTQVKGETRRSLYWVAAAYAAIIAVSVYLSTTGINGAYLYGSGMLIALLFGAVTGLAFYSNFGSSYRLRIASVSMLLGSLAFFFMQVTIYPIGSMIVNMAYYSMIGLMSITFVFVDLMVVIIISIPFKFGDPRGALA